MKTDNAIHQIIEIEDEASMDTFVHRLHPLVKLLVTVAFLGFVVSFGRYDLPGVLVMCIYPFIIFSMSLVSFKHCLKRIWPVIPVFALFGIFNIIFDRETAVIIAGLHISYGIISAFVLICKGILAVMSGYLLIAATGIENICYALRCIHIPQVIVTQILLTYRYLVLLIEQAGEIYTAYILRAPGQKGINIRAWGPLLGQLLLRTVDRAEVVYESMLLRGYNGSFPFKGRKGSLAAGITYLMIWTGIFILLRNVRVTELVGNLIMRLV